MVKTPGFCRHVEKEWLEQSLRWVANGAEYTQLNDNLDNFLSAYIVSKENRRKARNLLTSVWTQPVDQYIKNFFDKGIELHKDAESFSLPIHWGMLIARKPFFAEVARFIGRQARLNNTFTYAQAFRRMSMLYGETEATSRALSAVLRTVMELGILKRNISPACYSIVNQRVSISSPLANWLLDALLISSSKESIALDDALNDQALFPFHLDINLCNLDMSAFECLQQGNSIVIFKRNIES